MFFNSTDSGRVKIKSETPAPQPTPVSLSPPQPSIRVDTIPTVAFPEQIPDDRLVIAFTREGSPEAPPYASCVQDIVDLNPLRSEPSTIRLQDVTKAAMIQPLIEGNIMQTEDDKIWGVPGCMILELPPSDCTCSFCVVTEADSIFGCEYRPTSMTLRVISIMYLLLRNCRRYRIHDIYMSLYSGLSLGCQLHFGTSL